MFSKLYIDMCKQATEIQRNWKPSVGDFVALGDDVSVIIYSFRRGDKVKYKLHLIRDREFEKHELIWLPTQRQLQLIIDSHFPIPLDAQNMTSMLYNFAFSNEKYEYCTQFMTLNELWLAFLMDRCYNKRWDADKRKWVELEDTDEA